MAPMRILMVLRGAKVALKSLKDKSSGGQAAEIQSSAGKKNVWFSAAACLLSGAVGGPLSLHTCVIVLSVIFFFFFWQKGVFFYNTELKSVVLFRVVAPKNPVSRNTLCRRISLFIPQCLIFFTLKVSRSVKKNMALNDLSGQKYQLPSWSSGHSSTMSAKLPAQTLSLDLWLHPLSVIAALLFWPGWR